MSDHSAEFQKNLIDMILNYGIAIEKALNQKNYIQLMKAIQEFIQAFRNLIPIINTAIKADESGDDLEMVCTEEISDELPETLYRMDSTDDESIDDLPFGQFPSLYNKSDHGPS